MSEGTQANRVSNPPAEVLSWRNYSAVQAAMLGSNLNLPSAVSVYDYADAGQWYGGEVGLIQTLSDRDHSFARQIVQVATTPHEISNTLSPPEGIAFTANSAIPIADSVRSAYKTLGIPLPRLDYITSNLRLSFDEESLSYKRVDTGSESDEIQRLSDTFGGMQHVCVIDESTQSGFTNQHAGELLIHAGVKTVSLIHGMWYFEVRRKAVNKEDLTSTHRPIMRYIGRRVTDTRFTNDRYTRYYKS